MQHQIETTKEDPKRYEKNLLILVALLTSATISAQNGGTIMKKYENQLPQAGRGNVHVAYQGKAIDQMIYDFMEEQGIPGMTLAIVQAPYIPRVAGYGVTDLEKETLRCQDSLAHRSHLTRICSRGSDAALRKGKTRPERPDRQVPERYTRKLETDQYPSVDATQFGHCGLS